MTQGKDDGDPARDDASLQLVEEELDVGKRQTITGRVRIGTRTETIDRIVRQDLESTEVEVERVPMDRVLEPEEAPPVPRIEGDVTIIPVLEEVLVVETRLHLIEEVRVTTSASMEEVETPVALRRQRAVVERQSADTSRDPGKQ